MIPRYIIAIALTLLAGCSAVPGDAAYRAGEPAQAAVLYNTEYKNGSVDAGLSYAQMLSQGDGIPKDPEHAVEIWNDLASKGSSLALFNLGVCYERGTGVAKNLPKAEEAYRKAAESGMLWAIYNLGSMYSNRLTQKEDDVEGLTLLLRAQRLATGKSENERWIREDKFGGHVAKMRARMTPEQIARAEEAAKK